MTSHFFQYHLFKKFFLFLYLHLTFSGEGNGTPLQYSCLENPMDGGAWKAAVHGVAEGWARLSNFTFTFHFHALEKEMATHSSVLAWRIPGLVEPGGLPPMGLHTVGHDWSDLAASYFFCIQIKRKRLLKKKKRIPAFSCAWTITRPLCISPMVISVPNKNKLCNLRAISGSSSNIAIHTNGNLTFCVEVQVPIRSYPY